MATQLCEVCECACDTMYGVATRSKPLKMIRLFCAEYSLFYRALLQKRPMISRSLRIVHCIRLSGMHQAHAALQSAVKERSRVWALSCVRCANTQANTV